MKYSLAKYIVSIKSDNPAANEFFGNITIGGTNGDANDSIEISMDQNLWSIESFATGAYVFNKNLSKAGSVIISLSQLSVHISKLKNICLQYFNNNYEDYGFTITLSEIGNTNNNVCVCSSCFPQKIPTQQFQETAQKQIWTFLSGSIDFSESA